MFKTLRDYLWVLQAFLRGKVLRQKAYQPQGNCFRLPVPMTTHRILMLMKWWGLRPSTIKEFVNMTPAQVLEMCRQGRNSKFGRIIHDCDQRRENWGDEFGRYLDRKDEWYAEKDRTGRWSLARR